MSIGTHSVCYSVYMNARLSLGERIEDRIIVLGMTQQEVADALGVHQSTVSGWVSGSRPHRRLVPAISRLLGIPVEEILELGGYPRRSPKAVAADKRSLEEVIADPDLALTAYALDKMTPEQRRVFMQFVRQFLIEHPEERG